MPARGPFVGLQFKTVVTNGVPALVETPLTGSGAVMGAKAPVKLCVAPAPAKWDVFLLGGSATNPKSLGDIGQFQITSCQSVGATSGLLPTPVPAPVPPGLAAVKPCFTNSGAVANAGPCFGPANSLIAVRILSNRLGPYTLLQFQTVVTNGVPALVTSPLKGSGSLFWATVPAQLCVAKSPNKWQVWLYNQSKSAGEIGEFTITGCP